MRFSGVFIFNFEHISHIAHWSLKILHTNHSMLKGSTKTLRQFVNLIYVTVPFLYSMKIENQRFSDVFREYSKGAVA